MVVSSIIPIHVGGEAYTGKSNLVLAKQIGNRFITRAISRRNLIFIMLRHHLPHLLWAQLLVDRWRL